MPFLYRPALRLLWTSHRPQQRAAAAAAAAAAIVQRPLFVCTDYCVHVQHWEYSECVQAAAAAAAQSCGSTLQPACCCAETNLILCAKRCCSWAAFSASFTTSNYCRIVVVIAPLK
jgi:hypothetical protein